MHLCLLKIGVSLVYWQSQCGARLAEESLRNDGDGVGYFTRLKGASGGGTNDRYFDFKPLPNQLSTSCSLVYLNL